MLYSGVALQHQRAQNRGRSPLGDGARRFRDIGVHYQVNPAAMTWRLARSMILMSPGGERDEHVPRRLPAPILEHPEEEDRRRLADTYMEEVTSDPPIKAFVTAAHFALA